VRRPREDLPAVADFTLGLSQMQAGKDGIAPRRPAAKPNEFYKISLCKHFIQGDCPFGDGCHFAHGEHELKKFPRSKGGNEFGDSGDGVTDGEGELAESMFNNTENTTVDYFVGGKAGGGKPSPILEPEEAAFFIIQSARQRDLAISTVRQEWFVKERHAEMINKSFKAGKPVMIFFTVSDSSYIQGAVLMTSPAIREPELESCKEKEDFCYRFSCDWYRTCELPTSVAIEAAPELIIPSRKTQDAIELSSQTGEAVMKCVWNSPLVTLYESFDGEREPPKDDAILTDFRCPPPSEITWPTFPGPGFIFGCSSQTMDECLGRGIFGLPSHMKHAASCIRPGSSIFLFNVTDNLLFGIFEALTPAIMNIDPRAFSKNPKSTSSPFPVQIRVRVSLECPPLDDADPIVNDILRTRIGGRIGPLTFAQSEALASLLAIQCGAMQFMVEYRNAVDNGNTNVTAPPIALPPRKIQATLLTSTGDVEINTQ